MVFICRCHLKYVRMRHDYAPLSQCEILVFAMTTLTAAGALWANLVQKFAGWQQFVTWRQRMKRWHRCHPSPVLVLVLLRLVSGLVVDTWYLNGFKSQLLVLFVSSSTCTNRNAELCTVGSLEHVVAILFATDNVAATTRLILVARSRWHFSARGAPQALGSQSSSTRNEISWSAPMALVVGFSR